MEIISKIEAQKWIGQEPFDCFLGRKWRELTNQYGPYKMPLESGRQMALTKMFAYYMMLSGDLCVFVAGWGINNTIEHLDLYYGYTKMIRRGNLLMDMSIHLFKKNELDPFISILGMAILFSWDSWVFILDGSVMLRVSHDGWFEFRAADKVLGDLIQNELSEYGVLPFGT